MFQKSTTESRESCWKEKLKDWLSTRFSPPDQSTGPTIGVEQEFFIYENDGKSCSHEASQRFFRAFKSLPESCLIYEHDEGIGRHIAAITLSLDQSTVVVKYEHHPHLLEMELPPVGTVLQISELLEPCIDTIHKAAEIAHCRISFGPFLNERTQDQEVWSQHSLCEALRKYRREVNKDRPEVLADLRLMNFSAYISSTQIHIGDMTWDNLPPLLEKLYCLEPYVLPHTWCPDVLTQTNAPLRRWRGYSRCLHGLPLVGFPGLDSWTISSWLDALLKMPSADLTHEDEYNEIRSLFTSKRDLQIIKPREYGTIEFRADPSQVSLESILAIAALRIGIYESLAQGFIPELRFSQARTLWWERIQTGDLQREEWVLDLAATGLQMRGYGEEQYLLPFQEHGNGSYS